MKDPSLLLEQNFGEQARPLGQRFLDGMILEPPCGDGVDQLSFAIYFVYDYQRPFVCVFETVVCAKSRWREFSMQEYGDVRLVFLRVDIDALNFTKTLDEIIALKKHLDGFVACVAEEGHF